MANLNYFNGVVRILKISNQKILKNKYKLIKYKVQLPHTRGSRIIRLHFWGRLAENVKNNYQVNDYILVEGYVSLISFAKKKRSTKTSKKILLSAIKIYPFILNKDT